MKNRKEYGIIDGKFRRYGDILLEYLGNEETVYIPEGIKKIGRMAFRGAHENVKTVYLASSVKKIWTAAFANCPSLEFVYGDNVTEIHEYAFWGCKKLKKLHFPKLKKFYYDAFSGCHPSVEMSGKTKMLWIRQR